jgi:hypothetical protein
MSITTTMTVESSSSRSRSKPYVSDTFLGRAAPTTTTTTTTPLRPKVNKEIFDLELDTIPPSAQNCAASTVWTSVTEDDDAIPESAGDSVWDVPPGSSQLWTERSAYFGHVGNAVDADADAELEERIAHIDLTEPVAELELELNEDDGREQVERFGAAIKSFKFQVETSIGQEPIITEETELLKVCSYHIWLI